MTTGSWTQGAPGSTFYSWKSWQGADDPAHKAWNPYTAGLHSHKKSSCHLIGYPNLDPQLYISCNSFNMNSIYTENTELRLLNKLAAKAAGHEFNLGVFLGQSHEVVRSVEGTVRAITGVFRNLKKGNVGGAVRSLSRVIHGAQPEKYWTKASRKYGLAGTVKYSRDQAAAALKRKDISSAWLAMQYGWLPLLSDVKAATDAYHALYSGEGRSTSFSVQATEVEEFDSSTSPSLYTCAAVKRSSHRLRAELTAYQDSVTSLGLSDPVGVVWELVPYSFVVDWFLPLGSYFEARAQIPNLKGLFYRTEKTSVTFEFRSLTSAGAGIYAEGCDSVGREVSFRRHGVTDTLHVPFPKFVGLGGLTNHSNRIKNAIALLSNVIGK